ncbi:MAG: RhuM family protein [Pseudomonadota bacterium]
MKNIQGEVLLYRAADGGPALDVRLDRETVWLTQTQMAELFGVNVPAVFKHIKNIYATGELEPVPTVSKMEMVRQEGKRQVRRSVDHYNLDMVISVGYRVNSLRGTQFRIWATNVLRQHLVQGYTVHERRLKELNQAVRLIADVAQRRVLSGDEATALLNVVADYAYALEVLDNRRNA